MKKYIFLLLIVFSFSLTSNSQNISEKIIVLKAINSVTKVEEKSLADAGVIIVNFNEKFAKWYTGSSSDWVWQFTETKDEVKNGRTITKLILNDDNYLWGFIDRVGKKIWFVPSTSEGSIMVFYYK